MKSLSALSSVFIAFGSATAADKQAGSMRLRDHFAGCFHPSEGAAGYRVTFYFSLNNRGEVISQPRVALFGFKGALSEKDGLTTRFRESFAKCLPLVMNASLATSVPGKVYYLQYAVDGSGKTTEVLFRPFGSHSGDALESAPDLEPLPDQEGPPLVDPATSTQPPPWAGRPSPARSYRFGTIHVMRPWRPMMRHSKNVPWSR